MRLIDELRQNKLLGLVRYFRGDILKQRAALGAACAVLVVQIATELLVPWPLKVVIDNVIRQKPLQGIGARLLGPFNTSAMSLLWAMVAAMIALAIANAWLEYKAHSMLVRVGQRLILTIRQRVYSHLQRLSFSFHTSQPVGDLTARVTTDINSLQDLFVSGFKNLVTNGLLLAGMLAVMVAIDWTFTLVALAVIPALAWLILRFKPKVKQATRAAKKKEREMASLAQETLVSYRVVQAFSAEDFEEKRFADHGTDAMNARVQAGMLQARFAPSVDVTLAVGTALVVALGADQALKGHISIGVLLVLLTYLKSMYTPLKQLAKGAGQLTSASVSSELLVELLENDSRVVDSPNARPAPKLRGDIEYDHVTFAYCRERPALLDACFRIGAGQHCVIVGPTGAGKSTLVSLLPRFIDPVSGSVRIDGRDVREFTVRSLREQIAIVLQEAMLFHMSVRENIAYAMPGASEEQILAASKAANAHEFIVQLPQGYDTIIDERGGNLSGGQRQRLTLARAFLRNAPVLLLDEPTTGLDPASERLVLDALERLTAGRTTLTIAHRMITIETADLVLFVEDGRVVDRGKHRELLQRNARYRRLCQEELAEPGGPAEPGDAAAPVPAHG